MADEAWHGNRVPCKNKDKPILNQQKYARVKVETTV